LDDGTHLRVLFSTGALARVAIPYVLDRGADYGQDLSASHRTVENINGAGKKIVVEFSSPNLGKEFDGNHLRSTIIGNHIASQYEAMGWDVSRINFLGDWGKHIGLLAAGWARYGSEDLFQKDPLRHLLDVYAQIEELARPEQEAAKKSRAEGQTVPEDPQPLTIEKDAFFKKMEDGDTEALDLWKRFRDVCIDKYTDLYARMGLTFDEYSGESQVSHESVLEVERILREKGVYEERDDAWVIDFKKLGHKGLSTVVARFRNGTTSYLLRDVAAVLERSRKYSFDQMVYVVSAKQDMHFQQLFKTLELMDFSDLAGKLHHISFGKVTNLCAKEDSKGLLLEDILDQCQAAARTLLDVDPESLGELMVGDSNVVADALGGTALITQTLSYKRANTFEFDIDQMVDAEEYSGLALQHCYARLTAKLEHATIQREDLEHMDYAVLEQLEYTEALRLVIQFPSIVKTSFKMQESYPILMYLFRLAYLLVPIWEKENCSEGGSDQVAAQLVFYECVRHVLGNGMRMMGMSPVRT
jgi:arginyl-tRNA synthetase